MTENEQLRDVLALCERLRREAGTSRLRAAAEEVLRVGADAVPELLEAAKGTAHERVVTKATWAAWNRR